VDPTICPCCQVVTHPVSGLRRLVHNDNPCVHPEVHRGKDTMQRGCGRTSERMARLGVSFTELCQRPRRAMSYIPNHPRGDCNCGPRVLSGMPISIGTRACALKLRHCTKSLHQKQQIAILLPTRHPRCSDSHNIPQPPPPLPFKVCDIPSKPNGRECKPRLISKPVQTTRKNAATPNQVPGRAYTWIVDGSFISRFNDVDQRAIQPRRVYE
jgi:hypothetical protein